MKYICAGKSVHIYTDRHLADISVGKDFALDFCARYNLFYFYGRIICIFNAIKNS